MMQDVTEKNRNNFELHFTALSYGIRIRITYALPHPAYEV